MGERYLYKLDEQFDVSLGRETKVAGAGIQSSQCPWMMNDDDDGPEPSCIDIDWGGEGLENDEYQKVKGGVCPAFRGLMHKDGCLYVQCATPPEG